MNISSVNKIFFKIGEIQLRWRWIILGAIILFTAFCFSGLPKLKMANNEEEWFEDWEQVKIDSDRFKEIFGSDDAIMVMVQADDVFAPEVLAGIERLGRRLEEEVPYADKATSIVTAEIPIGSEESIEIKSPFEDGIPSDPAELKAKKDFILSRQSLVNNIVSDDSKESWVILSLENYDGGVEFAAENIARPAQKVILEENEKAAGAYTLKPTGMSYSEMEENDVVAQECKTRVLSGFFVMLLCLVIFVRSLRGVIVPLVATVAGIGSVLGLSAHLGFVADSNMITLPILLGMALSVGYSVHFVNSFRMHFRRTGARRDSVVKAVGETGWPILFTVITTIASLISFLFSGIGPIRWVGGISASIVFSVYLYVIVFIPILMCFGKDVGSDGEAGKTHEVSFERVSAKAVPEPFSLPTGATAADNAFARFGEKVTRHSKIVAFLSALVILAMVPGIFKISVNMDYVEMMGNEVPYVERLLFVLSGKLGSLYSYDVMISYDDSDAFKSAEKMKNLEKLSDRLGALKLTKISGGKPRVTSACQMLKEINRMFNDDDLAFYALSDDDAVTAQNLVFYSDSFEDWFDTESDDFGVTHIHVELAGYDANVIVSDIEGAKSSAKELFPDAKISIVGEVVEYAEMNHKLVSAELKSFSLSFVIIAILLILAFSSLETGLIGMIPNLAPVIVVGGVMGYAGYSLDMLTMTIMPMILGIAVDDTIHLINHIKLQLEKNGDYKEAVVVSFREIGKTMGMTTFILCAMFFMYTFSPMGCLFRIGMLAMIGLASALLADYTLTPALIALTKPFGKKIK
ncbi:MAG: MMPL family transporter [Treponema sp.]|uniref:efflux RND transporter permease subunit n=1 Tax=Treponema sp. TaxID=166 RepID=UPI0025E4818E|nr:MMPL family transporter [Treponema sp.]MBQ8678829.1 MMPL family transporter [Treponema sp.]